jgi:hypothetical protein
MIHDKWPISCQLINKNVTDYRAWHVFPLAISFNAIYITCSFHYHLAKKKIIEPDLVIWLFDL